MTKPGNEGSPEPNHGSRKVVLAALVANFVITVFKSAVAVFSGSTAMLAEAIHSLADTGNQVLLLVGLQRSAKPPDDLHPFGYGKEQYFWSFMVAMMLFFVGAVVSVYEGVHKVLAPQPIEGAWMIYAILGVSFVLEAFAFRVAFKEFQRTRKPGAGFMESVRNSKDSNVMVVLFEDSAALTGLAVAFVGVLAAELTGWMVLDGVASILIGVLLAVVALGLAWETRELLIGESASRRHQAAIRDATRSFSEVTAVGRILTMHLAPDRILVTMDLEFHDGLASDAIEDAVNRIEARIREQVPEVDRIFIEAKKVTG